MNATNAIAWGIIFMAATDIPPLANIAALLAWLIFVSVAMLFGPQALKIITGITAPSAAPSAKLPTVTPTKPQTATGGQLTA